MYLFPSRYNCFSPDCRSIEKLQETRYGVFIFFSVLLHLAIFVSLLIFNPENGSYLLPAERIVEVNIVSAEMKFDSAEPSSQTNAVVKKKEFPKNAVSPSGDLKKSAKPEVTTSKPVEKPVMVNKVIDPSKNSFEHQSTGSSEFVQNQNSPPDNVVDVNNGTLSEVDERYDNIPTEVSGESGELDDSTDNGFNPKGRHYVEENFYYIKDLITRNLIYPAIARRLKWQGTVEVSFVVLKTGNVKKIRIETSSGYSILDKNVLAAIKQAQPFPAPPSAAEFTMPIKYTLKNR